MVSLIYLSLSLFSLPPSSCSSTAAGSRRLCTNRPEEPAEKVLRCHFSSCPARRHAKSGVCVCEGDYKHAHFGFFNYRTKANILTVLLESVCPCERAGRTSMCAFVELVLLCLFTPPVSALHVFVRWAFASPQQFDVHSRHAGT